jgi:hypothetical protein
MFVANKHNRISRGCRHFDTPAIVLDLWRWSHEVISKLLGKFNRIRRNNKMG